MRLEEFENGELYHVYNRGVDKRMITLDEEDSERFKRGLVEFNCVDGIGSLHSNSYRDASLRYQVPKCVEILAYCLNPNHFHLILRQLVDGGISIFMRAHCGGYSRYFNIRHKRKGALFEGPYKVKWIEDEEDLRYKSVYVSRNNEVHQLGYQVSKLVRRSWDEYTETEAGLCSTKDVLGTFTSIGAYVSYADKALTEMLEAKRIQKELRGIEFEEE